MRISDTRYRWEFRLLPGDTAADLGSTETPRRPLIGPWVEGIPNHQLDLVRVEYTFRAQLADVWRDPQRAPSPGDAAHLTPFIGQGLCAGVRDSMNL